MRFNVKKLFLLCTIIALYLALLQSHFLLSLCLTSFCVTSFSLVSAIRQQHYFARQLVSIGSLVAFLTFLTFATSTLVVALLNSSLTGTHSGFGVGFHFGSFIATIGGGIAIAGAFLGLVAYTFANHFAERNPSQINVG